MGRLFWKFFFAFWLALLTAGIGVGTAVWWRHNQSENGQTEANPAVIDRHAGLFVGAASEIMHFGGIEALRHFLNEPRERPFPTLYAVDESGNDILGRNVGPEVLARARQLHAQETFPDAVRRISTEDGRDYLLCTVLPKRPPYEDLSGALPPPDEEFVIPPFDPGPQDRFESYPEGGLPPPSRPGHRSPKPPPPRLPIAAGLMASLLFSTALAWYFAKPIRSLRQAFADASQGKLDARLTESMGKRRDELADLGRDFDHMAAQLGSLITAQQRLLHDVSHELRSPLARIQAAIGLAQQRPEIVPNTLIRIERETQRVSNLVGELLVLSRLEAGVSKGENADIDLGELLADIIEDARFEAGQKGVTVRYTGIDEVIVKTRCELLHRAVENLLRNAVQYCKQGGEVVVIAEFYETSRKLHVSIDDQGPGVPEAELEAIFRPFFRGTNHTRPDGTGLGLAITQRAVAALGGTLEAQNRPEGGFHVEIKIRFPNKAKS